MTHEIYVLLGMFLCGAALSALFDLRRSLQKAVNLPDFIVAAADFFFWVICAAAVSWCIWTLNSGILRIYEFIGLILGIVIYFLTISRLLIKLFTLLIANILKIIAIILKILLTPIRFLYKIISSIHTKRSKKERLSDNERNKRTGG